MLLSTAFLGLFLVCVGMSLVCSTYMFMLWYASLRLRTSSNTTTGRDEVLAAAAAAAAAAEEEERKKKGKGLSVAELERLPGLDDGGLIVSGTECAVCLDDIEMGQLVRVLPECRHAFHCSCVDTWLAANAICPLCRTAPIPLPVLASPD